MCSLAAEILYIFKIKKVAITIFEFGHKALSNLVTNSLFLLEPYVFVGETILISHNTNAKS